MYSIKEYLIGFLLILSVAVSSWLVLKSSPDDASAALSPNQPDSYMENVAVTRMNDAGTLDSYLTSPLMIHYAKDNLTKITHPSLVLYQQTGQPWYLSADKGEAKSGIDTINLWDNVVLQEPASAQNQAMKITTSAISIYPKQQYAQTQQLVVGTQPGSSMRAVGMHVNFKTGIVDLFSRVQGQYQGEGKTK